VSRKAQKCVLDGTNRAVEFVRAAVGMGIPMGIPMGMGMGTGWVWGL